MYWYCIETITQSKQFQDKLQTGWQGHVFFEKWSHIFAEKYYWKYLESLIQNALDNNGWTERDALEGSSTYGTVITLTLAIKLQKMEIALL